MRVLVTGSRNWSDEGLVRSRLSTVYAFTDSITVVHGGCPTGADAFANEWVRSFDDLTPAEQAWLGRPPTVEVHPADWEGPCGSSCKPSHRRPRGNGTYCPTAGPRRNRLMVDSGVGLVLAFIRNGSRGATGTADYAESKGIRVERFCE